MKNEYTVKEIFKGTVGLTKVALGIDKSDEELVEERLNICLHCERLIKNEDKNKHKCGKCKCWISKKILLKTEKCPLNKW